MSVCILSLMVVLVTGSGMKHAVRSRVSARARRFAAEVTAKSAEIAAAGLPIIGSAGVGDTQPLIDAGVFLASDGTNGDELTRWFTESVIENRGTMRQICRETGEARFSLSESVGRYVMALRAPRSTGEAYPDEPPRVSV